MKRSKPLTRKTPMKRSIASRKTKTTKPPSACTMGRSTHRTHAKYVVGPDERLCVTHAKRIADKLVGDYVKNRDGVCQNCGTDRNLQWAHIVSRGAPYIRWDLHNAMALCSRCHTNFTIKNHLWIIFLEERSPGLLARLARTEAECEKIGSGIDVAEIIRTFRKVEGSARAEER